MRQISLQIVYSRICTITNVTRNLHATFFLEILPYNYLLRGKTIYTMKLKYIYTYIIFLATLSCQTRNEALETALQLAGENRSELEKVLDHYSLNPADSLKLQAAEFLIANMPGHYTLQGDLINAYRAKIDADTMGCYLLRKSLDISFCEIDWLRKSSYHEEDVEHIKADFLIRHIDLSFEKLHQYSWLKDIPFDIFLEYILPYRFANERLDLWRDSLDIAPQALEDLFFLDNTKYIMPKIINDIPLSKPITKNNPQILSELHLQNILRECTHCAIADNLTHRIASIPSCIEFIPRYANRNGFHQWCKIVSSESKNTAVMGVNNQAAKVYQKTYSRDRVVTPAKGEYIPDFFLNPFYKDVSDHYVYTADVITSAQKKLPASSRHAYLCVFNNLEWQPVDITTHQQSAVKFKNIGKNHLYLVTYYQKKKMRPMHFPFILNLKGEIKYLVPDTCTRQKITIKRKYPFNDLLHAFNKYLQHLVIEASNDPNFLTPDTIISQFDTSPVTYAQGYNKTDKRFRYWRVSNTTTHPVYMAELSFLDKAGKPLKGKTSPSDSLILDNDPLTNITLDPMKKIIIDFDTSVHAAKIVCLPRSDGNGIYPGNDYELFYHDLNGWQSLGRQIAPDYYLEYHDVPRGALLWLHNHTTGIEERIFTHENKEIRFW